MLTLLPLSGFTAALKRRNSKTLDFSRRDSISVYANYSLPNSKSSMRRFSTYDGLAPVFHILADEGKLPIPAPTEPAQKTLSLRRGSISSIMSFGKPKSKPAPSSPEDACARLDAQIERIKDQLAQLKNENLDMSERVNDLSSSVEELCNSPMEPARPRLSELRRHSIAEPMLRRDSQWQCSSGNLQVVQESDDLESDDGEEDLSFEDYCKSYIPKVGKREPHPKVQVPSFDEVDLLPDPKKNIMPNNLFRSNTKSVPARLDIIWNDLSVPAAPQSQRLSMISCHSDSVIFTGKYQASTSLSFEHTTS